MSDSAPENPNSTPQTPAGGPQNLPAAPAVPGAPGASPSQKPATRTARRPGPAAGSGLRRATGTGTIPPPPAKPDLLKTVAFAVCGILLAACLAGGVYVLFFKKGPAPKAAKLDEKAQDLADKAAEAKALYEAGHEKAKGTTLEDLTEASVKLDRARVIFNDVAERYLTVPGHEADIEFARNKKDSIDNELKVVRTKQTDLEMEALRNKPKTTETTTAGPGAAPTTPPPATPATAPGEKEPTADELSDKNLDRLFNDDPSEYERLAKIREKRDPNFKMKKP